MRFLITTFLLIMSLSTWAKVHTTTQSMCESGDGYEVSTAGVYPELSLWWSISYFADENDLSTVELYYYFDYDDVEYSLIDKTDVHLITNAESLTFTRAESTPVTIGDKMVVFRNTVTGYYAVFEPTKLKIERPVGCNYDPLVLEGKFYFQDNKTGNFSN